MSHPEDLSQLRAVILQQSGTQYLQFRNATNEAGFLKFLWGLDFEITY